MNRKAADLLSGARAEARGDTLIVKLPIVQLAAIFIAAGSVLAGVWVTTRDLGHEVRTLTKAVTELSEAVKSLHARVDDHEIRLRMIEHENDAANDRPRDP